MNSQIPRIASCKHHFWTDEFSAVFAFGAASFKKTLLIKELV